MSSVFMATQLPKARKKVKIELLDYLCWKITTKCQKIGQNIPNWCNMGRWRLISFFRFWRFLTIFFMTKFFGAPISLRKLLSKLLIFTSKASKNVKWDFLRWFSKTMKYSLSYDNSIFFLSWLTTFFAGKLRPFCSCLISEQYDKSTK